MSADEFSVYQKFMRSLDSAFMCRRGAGVHADDDWGERFFEYFDDQYRPFDEAFVNIYAAASQLLNHFALRREMEDYAWCFYRNPESFAKTIFFMMETGLLP